MLSLGMLWTRPAPKDTQNLIRLNLAGLETMSDTFNGESVESTWHTEKSKTPQKGNLLSRQKERTAVLANEVKGTPGASLWNKPQTKLTWQNFFVLPRNETDNPFIEHSRTELSVSRAPTQSESSLTHTFLRHILAKPNHHMTALIKSR